MHVDVVVVGGGGSGLAAAIGASENGASVVLLEKNPVLGGTTACSVGSITAAGTPHQRRMGIVDSPAEHFQDMELFSRKYASRPDNDVLRRVLTENVPETVRWLAGLGVEFFGPMEEPPHRKPRMHNAVPNSRAYIFHLERCARRLGVRILAESRARRLLFEGGRVTGVEFEKGADKRETVHARLGIVLAAGDYSADREMKRRLISEAVADIQPVNPTSTGDGQRMALEVGARIVNGDLFGGGLRFVPPPRPSWISKLPPWRWCMRPVNFALRYAPHLIVRPLVMGFLTTVLVPDQGLFEAGAILINKRGERFADETSPMVFELASQPDGVAYIVFDEALARKFSSWPHFISTAPGFAYTYLSDYERNRPDLFHRAPTLDKLAFKLRADPAKLIDAVAQYNRSGAGEAAPAAALARGRRSTLGVGSYYALGPVKNYVSFTDGGLAVSERLEVLGADDRPIPGLFAAGSTGQGGLLLKGHGHHLGWAFTSGRLAGKSAASRNGG